MMRSIFSSVMLILFTGLCACDHQVPQTSEDLPGANPARGRAAVRQYGCASCHTIPGVRGADGLVGPSLEHIGSRTYIGGVLENSPDNLVRWLKDPPGVDPKTAMPNLHLSDADAKDIAGYLYTLR